MCFLQSIKRVSVRPSITIPSFFNELKRRNVFKVGIAYIVIAWLIAQVLQLVFEGFGTPDWAIKTLLVLLATGLPITLFFAWAFELTPEGIKKDKGVDQDQSIANAGALVQLDGHQSYDPDGDAITYYWIITTRLK